MGVVVRCAQTTVRSSVECQCKPQRSDYFPSYSKNRKAEFCGLMPDWPNTTSFAANGYYEISNSLLCTGKNSAAFVRVSHPSYKAPIPTMELCNNTQNETYRCDTEYKIFLSHYL